MRRHAIVLAAALLAAGCTAANVAQEPDDEAVTVVRL